MRSDEHDELKNPFLEETVFGADFVAEYETKHLGSKTGDAVFHGCATTAVDLAVGYEPISIKTSTNVLGFFLSPYPS